MHRLSLEKDSRSHSPLHYGLGVALFVAVCLVVGFGVWVSLNTAERRAARVIWDYYGMPSYTSRPPNWAVRLKLASYFEGPDRLTGAIFSGVPLADSDLERLAAALLPLEDFRWMQIYGTNVSLKGLTDLREALPHVHIAHDSDDKRPGRWLVTSIRAFLRRGGVGEDYLWALEAVRSLEDKGEAIRELAELLDEEKPGDIACGVLGQIGPEAIPILIDQLRHKRPKRRLIAAMSLGDLETKSEEVISALTEATDDVHGSVRLSAAYALWQIDGPQQVAMDVLTASLTDEDEKIRLNAVNTILLIGPPAKFAVPALTELLSDESPEIQRAAEKALSEIPPETFRNREQK